jgi:hypothetical protein
MAATIPTPLTNRGKSWEDRSKYAAYFKEDAADKLYAFCKECEARCSKNANSTGTLMQHLRVCPGAAAIEWCKATQMEIEQANLAKPLKLLTLDSMWSKMTQEQFEREFVMGLVEEGRPFSTCQSERMKAIYAARNYTIPSPTTMTRLFKVIFSEMKVKARSTDPETYVACCLACPMPI